MIKAKVSIIVPTYGRSDHLKKLIESVRVSTPADAYEFVIVSSDPADSEKIVWLKEQPDLNLILADERQPGQLMKKSLYYYTNLGIKQACYEWIFTSNDDMVFAADWYENFLQVLADNDYQKLGMIIAATHIGSVELGCRVPKIGRSKKSGQDWRDLYLADFSIIKKETLEQIGYFDEKIMWFGSGVNNALAVEFLTDQATVVAENIKVDHALTEEARQPRQTDVFYDFNYIKRRWDRWCQEHDCQYQCDFGVEPYTLKNRIKYFLKKLAVNLKKK